jgi:hypothetical protein
MGSSQSVEIPGGGSDAYHVLKVKNKIMNILRVVAENSVSLII